MERPWCIPNSGLRGGPRSLQRSLGKCLGLAKNRIIKIKQPLISFLCPSPCYLHSVIHYLGPLSWGNLWLPGHFSEGKKKSTVISISTCQRYTKFHWFYSWIYFVLRWKSGFNNIKIMTYLLYPNILLMYINIKNINTLLIKYITYIFILRLNLLYILN